MLVSMCSRDRRDLGLEFTVGHSLDPDAAVRAIGCYTGTHEGCRHVQPSAFVLESDGTIAHAVYSTGKVGRLTARDALEIIRGRKSLPAGPAAGWTGRA